MKYILYILICCTSFSCFSQTFYLKINGSNSSQTKIIDSISYKSKHTILKSLFDEIKITEKKLSNLGYLDIKTVETKKTNDSTYTAIFDLKKQIKEVHIYIGIKNSFSDSKKMTMDSIIIPYSEVENFINQEISNNEKKGFAFTKIKLENVRRKNSVIYADLNFNSSNKRTINSIIINYTNPNIKNYFPKGALKQLNKKYLNKTFNQEITKKLYEDINSFEFVSQTKYPEILFTNDSTKIYTYIEKKKANTFDGYIGFSNDEDKKVNLNGYLDISLVNTLRAGEKFSLYWKSDGNDQKTFNTKLEIPYLFQTSLGLKAQLNIFKQDSTFQNTKTDINLGYYLNYNSKVYIGYQSTESSDIQNVNNSQISDFTNSFLTSTFTYRKNDFTNILSPNKASIDVVIGYGSREIPNSLEIDKTSKQILVNLSGLYNFELNRRNFINISSQNYFLKSKNYISNELFRFGGMNSIRGFLDNSLQGNFTSMILTEYRYFLSKNLYINSILDYAIYQDLSAISGSQKIKNLTGIGFGATLLTVNGILKINLTNGSEKATDLQLFNTIVNICYNVKFWGLSKKV